MPGVRGVAASVAEWLRDGQDCPHARLKVVVHHAVHVPASRPRQRHVHVLHSGELGHEWVAIVSSWGLVCWQPPSWHGAADGQALT